VTTGGFRYLNREGRWEGWTRHGIEVTPEGEARLIGLPSATGNLDLSPLVAPEHPAGISEDGCGSLWYTGFEALIRRDCFGQDFEVPVQAGGIALSEPAGLSYLPLRDAIAVSDRGNNRVLLLGRKNGAISEVIGSATATPDPDAPAGTLSHPTHSMPDEDGNLYVLDSGNQRVQKFGKTGAVQARFWSNVRDSGLVVRPSGLAVEGAVRRIWIMDPDRRRVFAFDLEGRPLLHGDAGEPLSIALDAIGTPIGIAAANGFVYVGDNTARRIAVFRPDDEQGWSAYVTGYIGPTGALAIGSANRLLVHPGSSTAPVECVHGNAFGESGLMWTGPVTTASPETIWHTLRASVRSTGAGSDIKMFWAVSEAGAPPVHPGFPEPFPVDRWHSFPAGATHGFVDRFHGGPLFVGVHFTSDGSATNVLRQVRADFNRDSWLPLLPEIYRRPVYASDPKDRDDFLLRYLSLFESFTDDATAAMESVLPLFDAEATPLTGLDWLAGLLDAWIEEDWTEDRKRQSIARAFHRHARRGTPGAIREALRQDAGVDVALEEPARQAGFWALAEDDGSPGDSILGFTTALAGAEAQGAVLGSTATLERSNLIRNEEFGAPLFEDLVHRFTVTLRGRSGSAMKDKIDAVLEREAPAHVTWCVETESRAFLVGFSSRVGVDTTIAPRRPTAAPLGMDRLVLSGIAVAGVGKGSAIGLSTTI
jgi:phage tail-like protein